MFFYLKMAMRNIFRNKKRTFLTGLIIGVGLASLMFTDAMVVGMKRNLINSVTSTFLGDAQIHCKGFTDTQDIEKTIIRPSNIISRLESDPAVRNITSRVISYGTISSAANINSILIYGIEPSSEKPMSKIDDALISGDYLSDNTGGGIIIGADLAKRLEVSVGERTVLTVSEIHSGELSRNLFRVKGIFKLNSKELDASAAFILLDEARNLLGMDKGIHEIALSFTFPDYAVKDGEQFAEKYSLYGNTAQAWPSLVPQMSNILGLVDYSVAIIGVIVFAVIVFGIINTLFMSLYERLFEFGVLRAVGTRPFRMGLLVVTEAGALAVYSIIIGLVLGFCINLYFSIVGINYTGLEFAGATIREPIYTVFQLQQFTLHPLLILGFTLLVSIYPARFISKMPIVRALQRTL